MTDVDARLKALFEADAPPRNDPIFVIEAARRAETRRLWLDLAGAAPWTIAAAALLWLFAPAMGVISRQAAGVLSLIIPAAALALGVLALFHPAPRRDVTSI
jgi:hypothetical protein